MSAPFWARVRDAQEAATKALSATTPEGWSNPEAAMGGSSWGSLAIWLGKGPATVSACADMRRGHAGEIVVRAMLQKPRGMMLVATAATVEADLRAAFQWAMDNLGKPMEKP